MTMRRLIVMLLLAGVSAVAQTHTTTTLEDSQTVSGKKTFTQNITITATPSNPTDAATKAYVDANAGTGCVSNCGSTPAGNDGDIQVKSGTGLAALPQSTFATPAYVDTAANARQAPISLTTTGANCATSTFAANVLNIPPCSPTGGTTNPGGSASSTAAPVQFNATGAFGGDTHFVYNPTTHTLQVDSVSATSSVVAGTTVSAQEFVGAATLLTADAACSSGVYWVAPIAGSTNAWRKCENGTLSNLGSGGSTSISGLTSGYIPLAGSATSLTASSHLDDGVTTTGMITSHEQVHIAWSNTDYSNPPTYSQLIVDNPATTGGSTQTQIALWSYDGVADEVNTWFGVTSHTFTYAPFADTAYVENYLNGVALYADSPTNGVISFFAGGYTSTAYLRMQIQPTGLIGIGTGTTAPMGQLEIDTASGRGAGGQATLRLAQLANNANATLSYASIDFAVPTTGISGQFLSTASNYSQSGVNLAANSVALMAEATSGQLGLFAGGSSGYVSINAGGYSSTYESARFPASGGMLLERGSLTLSGIASGTQCLHANSSGVISGTGSDCGSGGSGSGATTQIAQTVVSGTSTGAVTFSSIPGTYTNLRLVISGRTSDSAADENVNLTLNSDTGNNYDYIYLINGTSILNSKAQPNAPVMIVPGSTAASSTASQGEIRLSGYASTSFYKTFASVPSTYVTDTTVGDLTQWSFAGQWRNTAAITSITLTDGGGGHFMAGSIFTLYGEQ